MDLGPSQAWSGCSSIDQAAECCKEGAYGRVADVTLLVQAQRLSTTFQNSHLHKGVQLALDLSLGHTKGREIRACVAPDLSGFLGSFTRLNNALTLTAQTTDEHYGRLRIGMIREVLSQMFLRQEVQVFEVDPLMDQSGIPVVAMVPLASCAVLSSLHLQTLPVRCR